MNKRSILGLVILLAFSIAHSGCKDRHNPLGMLFHKTQADTNNNLADFSALLPFNNNAEMPTPPPPGALLPPPPPPMPAPPVPVDDLNGFVDYDGPIYSLCGNGVVNRVVNRIACPAYGPQLIFQPNGTSTLVPDTGCNGFVYIEQCDDGNTFDNDGCSSVCLKECCGNGIVEQGEECDLGQNRGPVLPEISPPAGFPIAGVSGTSPPTVDASSIFTKPFAACSRSDLVLDTANCSRNCQLVICGDGIVNGKEQCDDGNNLGGDGCFKCTVETPGSCPGNCCPDPGVEICNNKCCKPNETCNAMPTPPSCQCVSPSKICGPSCCSASQVCVNNSCLCPNVTCNNICCTAGQSCTGVGGSCAGP